MAWYDPFIDAGASLIGGIAGDWFGLGGGGGKPDRPQMPKPTFNPLQALQMPQGGMPPPSMLQQPQAPRVPAGYSQMPNLQAMLARYLNGGRG